MAAAYSDIVISNKMNAAWWRDLLEGEKIGFVRGVQECQLFDLHTESWLYNADTRLLVAMLDKFVDVYPADRSTPIEQIMEELTSLKRPPNKSEVDEPKEQRAHYETWAQMVPGASTGYVEGYMACRQRHGPIRWSLPVHSYVQKLDRYYNVDEVYGPDQGEGLVSDFLAKEADHK